MFKNTLKSNKVDVRQYPRRNRKLPNCFGDNNLTVQSVLCNNGNSSATSILTIDNLLTSITDTKVKENSSIKKNNTLFKKLKKKRKKYILTNVARKKSDS